MPAGRRSHESRGAATRALLELIGRWLTAKTWPVIITAMVAVALLHIGRSGFTWHYVETGTRELFSRRSLHVYADHPEVQMGPLTFVVSAPFVLPSFGLLGQVAAMVALSGVGLGCLRQVQVIMGLSGDSPGLHQAAPDRLFLVGALLFVPAWVEVAVHWQHPDDACALFCAVYGLRLALTDRWVAAAVILGLAVDFKPWSVPFVALLLLVHRRRWLGGGVIWVLVVVAAWLPFLLADPQTIRLTSFGIVNDHASVLRLFGVTNQHTPSWCRPAQLLGGSALAAILVLKDRWPGAIAAVIATRMLLDPGVKNYYDAGLLMGAVTFDVMLSARRIPWMTLVGTVLVYLPSYLLSSSPFARSVLRAAGLFLIVFMTFLVKGRHLHRPKIKDGGKR